MTTPSIRAKFNLSRVEPVSDTQERLHFNAVAAGSYPEDGSDENNTFAKFTPQAGCIMDVTNPALLGKFVPGTAYYVDFTPADAA